MNERDRTHIERIADELRYIPLRKSNDVGAQNLKAQPKIEYFIKTYFMLLADYIM